MGLFDIFRRKKKVEVNYTAGTLTPSELAEKKRRESTYMPTASTRPPLTGTSVSRPRPVVNNYYTNNTTVIERNDDLATQLLVQEMIYDSVSDNNTYVPDCTPSYDDDSTRRCYDSSPSYDSGSSYDSSSSSSYDSGSSSYDSGSSSSDSGSSDW